jgi:hypothetical protein
LVPSDLVIVLRSLDFALPEAVTVPLAITGGQAPVHAPVQADVPLPSLAHRYTARPEPSVRIVPPELVAVVMTVEPEPPAALDAPAGEAAPAPGLLLPLAHAAASTATAAAPPTPVASLATGDIRFIMVLLICCSPV